MSLPALFGECGCTDLSITVQIHNLKDVSAAADYIDFQNRRPDYIGEFVENLINWKKVICFTHTLPMTVAFIQHVLL